MTRLEHVLFVVRQVILFLLGIGVILDAIITKGSNGVELAIGAVLLGLGPVETRLMGLPSQAPAGRSGSLPSSQTFPPET
jgi:hypothetical protein